MGKSLQEQLLASGAAKPKQAKKARREKTRQEQKARRDASMPEAKADLAREIAAAEAAKRERDHRLNAEAKAQRERRENDLSAAQLIDRNRIDPAAAAGDGVAYNYTVDGRIKRIEVSDEQRRNLAAGRLAIVHHRGRSSLVSAAVAQRLRAVIPDHIWQVSPEDDRLDPDDPYAAFQVPDDLIW